MYTMSMDPYSGDPLIIDSGDGGDLIIDGGQPRMSSGIENAAYTSMFCDSNWWGNAISDDEIGSRHFLALTSRAKLTPDLLKDAEAATQADLAWMIEDGVIKTIEPVASIVALGWVGLEITFIEPDGATHTVRWRLNWARMAEEFAA